MNRALGYAQIITADETVTLETFTCRHCNNIVRMQPNVSLKGLENAIVSGKEVRDIRRCHGCDALICPVCFKEPKCVEFEKRLDDYEKKLNGRRTAQL